MADPIVVNPYMNRKLSKEELAKIPDLRPDRGELRKGLGAFVDETQAVGHGVYALGAQHLKNAFDAPDDSFLGRQVQSGLEGYTRNMDEATRGVQAPKVARVEDIKDVGSGIDWAAYNLAKGIPQLATLALGGGVGAGVAKATAKKAVKDQAKNAVTKELREAASEEIRNRVIRGGIAGGFASGAGFEGGHAFGAAVEEGIDQAEAAAQATVVGGINGALEFLPFYAVAKKVGMGDFAKKGIREIIKNDPGLSKKAVALAAAKEASKRAGGAGLVGAGTEGITEGLQELVSIAGMRWAENEPLFGDLSDDDWSQVKNAVAAGTLIGGFAGGAGGVVVGPRRQQQETVPPTETADPNAPVVDPTLPPEPGTDPKLIGQTKITPMHPEKKQPIEPGPPKLEQLPLQGELVDPETAVAVQGEQLQLEAPVIEGTFKDITDQLRVGEQKKLTETIQVRDPKTETIREIEEPWIESLEGNFVLMVDSASEQPYAITDVKGDLVAEGNTKAEALEQLEDYKGLLAEEFESDFGVDSDKIDVDKLAAAKQEYQEFLDNTPHTILTEAEVFAEINNIDEAVASGALSQSEGKAKMNELTEKVKQSKQLKKEQADLAAFDKQVEDDIDSELAELLEDAQDLGNGYKLIYEPSAENPYAVVDKNNAIVFEGIHPDEAGHWLDSQGLLDTDEGPTQAGALPYGFSLEQLTPESPVIVYDPDGEPVGQYNTIDDFELSWDPEGEYQKYTDSLGDDDLPGIYSDELAAKFDAINQGTEGIEIEEFQDDPAAALKVDEIQQQLEDGLISKDEAINAMAGLANQLMGDPVVEPPTIFKTAEMTKTGEQAGSNKGGWFTDSTGNDWYIKQGQTTDHVLSEYITGRLYDLTGVSTPQAMVMDGNSDGFDGPVIAAKKVTSGTDNLKDGFVFDAWLGNWDVAGLSNNNYIGTPEEGIRIDFGGALRYRAQGGQKGDGGTQEFGDTVGELESLRDPNINPAAAKLFKNVTDEDIIQQAGTLARIDNNAIRKIVTRIYNGNQIKYAGDLASTLIARKEYILNVAESLKQKGPQTDKPGSVESLQHWVKDFDPAAPLTTQLKYQMEDPHKGIWAEIGKEESRYGILLINPENGKVLLRKPSKDEGTGKEFDGYAWTFAKGKGGKGEHPSKTAIRELQEETGYNANLVGQLYKPFYSGSGTGALFYVGVSKGDPQSFGTETQELKWATYEEALALVKQGTNKQGVARDIDVLKNLFGAAKPEAISEFPIKEGATHAKSYYKSGQFAEDAPWTPWKHKEWEMLTPLRQLHVKSAAYLQQLNKDNEAYGLTESDINYEVARIKKAFKKWSGFDLMQVINKLPQPSSETKMEQNFPIQTGKPFVVKAYHGNHIGEIQGDRLNPAKYQGQGAGGSDTHALSHKNGVFFLSNTIKGAKAWAGSSNGKVFNFYFAAKNPKVVWWNKHWSGSGFTSRIVQADKEGHDSIIFVNASDSGGKYHQMISFHAQQQIKTTMLENIGYSTDPKSKVYESQAGQDPKTNPKERFDHDFANAFGEGVLAQATESGLLKVNQISPEGSPAGSFDKATNQITINLDRIGANETPMSVLLHEGRHAGMQEVLGESLPLFHKDLLDLADRGNIDAQSSITRSTGAVADLLGIEHELYNVALPPKELEAEVKAIRQLIQENERGTELLLEEDLAYYIQDSANTVDLNAPGLFRRIMNALKVWWAQSGVGQMFAQAGLRAELTPEMAVELAKAATVKWAVQDPAMQQGEGAFASEPIDLDAHRKAKQLDEFRKDFMAKVDEGVTEHQARVDNTNYKYEVGDVVLSASTGRRIIIKGKTLIDDFREPLPPFKEAKARRAEIKSRPKIPGYFVEYNDADGKVTTQMAEWGIGSKATGPQSLESIPNPLAGLKRWWGESNDTPLDANNVDLMGKFRAHIIDNLATIDEKSTDVHKVAEVAKSKTSAEQSKINRMYLEPLVQMAKATGLNQQQLDEWLLARHVLLDDENWQNTQKRSWMMARDLAKSLPKNLRKEIEERRASLTKELTWIDKEGKKTKIPKAKVQDRMIDLVNEYFQKMEDLEASGGLKPQFTAWKDLQEQWIKVQAHSGGLYSPGAVDANGQLLPGQPKRKNVSNAPDAYDIYHSYNEDKVQREALEKMAKKWDEMTQHQLDLLVEGGKITSEEAINMRNAHPHYVKSRRASADNDKSFEFLHGSGTGPGKPKVRAGAVEYDPVVHVMQNTIAQAHANAAAAQQNQAALYLYREVVSNKEHWEGWFTKEKEEVHHLDTFGFLHDRPTSRPEPFDIPVTIMSDNGQAGHTEYLRPIPQNQKAKLFAAGMNKLGVQQQGAVSKILNFGNKVVRNMAVTFSPAFLAANIFRDPATALYNLQAGEGKDYTKDFLLGSNDSGRTGLGNAWKILNSVYTNRDNADPQHVKWVEEWEHAGGRQSFTQALKEMDEGWKSFEGALKLARTPGISQAANALGWVEKYNIIVENVSRFSAYSTVMDAWERGDIPKWETREKAQREAAIISKELTTNFDRKGFSSQSIGLWHLFFNATVQGNVQVVRNLLGSKKLQKMVAGTVVTATMFDMLGRMMADDDEEGRNEWDNIPDYIKDRNIILPFKIGGVYVKIPAPWVYNSVWRAGGMIGELAADKRDMASVPVDMGLLLLNTFNPMASASMMQTLSPTILDPFVQAVENKNFAGNPIKPTSFPGAAALPESQLYWNNTPKAYVALAETLNALSGGDVAKSGFVDISPGVIHNYVKFFSAGVGKALGQVYDLGGGKLLNEEEYEVRDVPILSTYAHSPGAQVDVQLYHDRVAQVLQAQKAVDLYGKGKTRDIEKQRDARIKYAKELRLVNHVKDVERQLKSLRTKMRAAQGRKDTQRVKQLKERLTSIQQKFNKTYERRQ